MSEFHCGLVWTGDLQYDSGAVWEGKYLVSYMSWHSSAVVSRKMCPKFNGQPIYTGQTFKVLSLHGNPEIDSVWQKLVMATVAAVVPN